MKIKVTEHYKKYESTPTGIGISKFEIANIRPWANSHPLICRNTASCL